MTAAAAMHAVRLTCMQMSVTAARLVLVGFLAVAATSVVAGLGPSIRNQ